MEPLNPDCSVQSFPQRWSQSNADVHAARRSYKRIFNVLAATSCVLYAINTWIALLRFSPRDYYYRYSFVWNMYTQEQRPVLEMLGTAVSRLVRTLGEHPVVSALGCDVLLSGLTLSVWAAVRGVDITAVLSCSVAPWLDNGKDSTVTKDADAKHDKAPASTATASSSAKRPRGRSKKSDPAGPSSAGLRTRRSSRRLRDAQTDDAEEDEDYVPPPTTRAQVAQMVHEDEGNGDLSEDVEAGALT